jgi:hypothetical protein
VIRHFVETVFLRFFVETSLAFSSHIVFANRYDVARCKHCKHIFFDESTAYLPFKKNMLAMLATRYVVTISENNMA